MEEINKRIREISSCEKQRSDAMLRAYIEPIENFLESDGPVQDILNKVYWFLTRNEYHGSWQPCSTCPLMSVDTEKLEVSPQVWL